VQLGPDLRTSLLAESENRRVRHPVPWGDGSIVTPAIWLVSAPALVAGHADSKQRNDYQVAKPCLEPSSARWEGTVIDPNSPQVLTTALTEQEAALIVNHLDAQGIRADIWGARGLAAWPDVPRDIRIVVRQADLSRAKEALDRVRQR